MMVMSKEKNSIEKFKEGNVVYLITAQIHASSTSNIKLIIVSPITHELYKHLPSIEIIRILICSCRSKEIVLAK